MPALADDGGGGQWDAAGNPIPDSAGGDPNKWNPSDNPTQQWRTDELQPPAVAPGGPDNPWATTIDFSPIKDDPAPPIRKLGDDGPGGGGGGGNGPAGAPGPTRTPGLGATPPGGTGSSTKPATTIFDAYSGPEIDEAKNITKQYMQMIGYPRGVDADQMALYLLDHHLEGNPSQAFENLFFSPFTNVEMRNANPWARYGFDPDSYRTRLTTLQSTLSDVTGIDVNLISTGQTSEMEQLLQRALKDGWSQSQLTSAFRSGSFQNLADQKVDLSSVVNEQPWLSQGQTFISMKNQYTNIFGAPPVDTKQLAGWYHFNQSAAHLGGGRPATETEKSKILVAGGGVEVR